MINEQQFEAVEDQLSNNDVSSDEEMRELFITEIGLTAEDADEVMALRPEFLISPLAKLVLLDGRLSVGSYTLRNTKKP